MKYLDPSDYTTSDIEYIKEQINNIQNEDEFKNFIDNLYPGWCIGWMREYCADYPLLDRNWKFLCQGIKCTPKCIVIVDEIWFNDQNRQILSALCEKMASSGYVVRRKEELTWCVKCSKALPTLNMYAYMKHSNIKEIPEMWSDSCTTCRDS
jgi:hypothetical protein